ncbi:MAG: hypothetical protein ACYDGN_15060 [Acidimicrobiales bacterium]
MNATGERPTRPNTWSARGHNRGSPSEPCLGVVLERDEIKVGSIRFDIDHELPWLIAETQIRQSVLAREPPKQVCRGIELLGFGPSDDPLILMPSSCNPQADQVNTPY